MARGRPSQVLRDVSSENGEKRRQTQVSVSVLITQRGCERRALPCSSRRVGKGRGFTGIGAVLGVFSAELLLLWQPVGAGRTRVAEGSQGGFLVCIGKTCWDFFWEN